MIYAHHLVGKAVNNLFAAVFALHHVLKTSIDALEAALEEFGRVRLDLSTLDELRHLLEEVRHVAPVLFARGEWSVTRKDERTAERSVDERALHLDVGAQALRLLLGTEDGHQLAAAGAEGLDAKLLRLELGDGVQPDVDAVVRDLLDLADSVRVLVVNDRVRTEGLAELVVPGRSSCHDLVSGDVRELNGEHADRTASAIHEHPLLLVDLVRGLHEGEAGRVEERLDGRPEAAAHRRGLLVAERARGDRPAEVRARLDILGERAAVLVRAAVHEARDVRADGRRGHVPPRLHDVPRPVAPADRARVADALDVLPVGRVLRERDDLDEHLVVVDLRDRHLLDLGGLVGLRDEGLHRLGDLGRHFLR